MRRVAIGVVLARFRLIASALRSARRAVERGRSCVTVVGASRAWHCWGDGSIVETWADEV